jgi:hypothetical protein
LLIPLQNAPKDVSPSALFPFVAYAGVLIWREPESYLGVPVFGCRSDTHDRFGALWNPALHGASPQMGQPNGRRCQRLKTRLVIASDSFASLEAEFMAGQIPNADSEIPAIELQGAEHENSGNRRSR